MELQPITSPTAGNLVSQEFSIDLSNQTNFGVAFDIISSGIYSNKPLAIARELSCNAYDSHVRAGKANTPFKIQLPDPLNPSWRIRDYGTGLSPDDVFRLLAGIFNSDKRTTNAEIGGFGLGSKTPFSYVDSYDIVSYWQGTAYCFVAFRDETGCPRISLSAQYPTDEVNGIEISVPVLEKDFLVFAEATYDACEFFPCRPVVEGEYKYRPFRWKMHEILAEDENGAWQVLASKNQNRIVMGGVSYPIEDHNLQFSSDNEDEVKLRDFIANIRGLVLNVPTGSIRVTASREDVSYTPQTISTLRQLIAQCQSKLEGWVEHLVDDVSTSFEKQRMLLALRNHGCERLLSSIGYDAKSVRNYELKTLDKSSCPITLYRMQPGGRAGSISLYEQGWHHANPIVQVDDRFLWQESEKLLRPRLRELRAKDNLRHAEVLIGALDDVYRALDHFGIPRSVLEDISNVPVPRAKPINHERQPYDDLYVLKATKLSNLNNESWDPIDDIDEIEDMGNIYYVPLTGYQMRINEDELKRLAMMRKYGCIDDHPIIGVRSRALRAIEHMSKEGDINATPVRALIEQFNAKEFVHTLLSKAKDLVQQPTYGWSHSDMYAWRRRNTSYHGENYLFMKIIENIDDQRINELRQSLADAAKIGRNCADELDTLRHDAREVLPDTLYRKFVNTLEKMKEKRPKSMRSDKLRAIVEKHFPVVQAMISPYENSAFLGKVAKTCKIRKV